MKAEIEVTRPGLFSTIQDMGRRGYLRYGVPVSGVMDQYAAKIGNLLLQNPADAAVLEMTLIGPTLIFHGSAKIAISGADFSPQVNKAPVSNNAVIIINPGDELSFGRRIFGCRTYLAVSGGFQTENPLDSQSWYEGVTAQSKLERGDKIPFNSAEDAASETQTAVKVESGYMEQSEIAAFPGPEYHLLSKEEQEILLNFQYSVGKNANRMAIQLKEEFENTLAPILTGPVLPGTVQLTPSGRLIILMRDCQTTGGYPRVLQISEEGMNVLAQKVMGDKLQFNLKIHQ